MAKRGYENEVSAVVAKLLLRENKTHCPQRFHWSMRRTFRACDLREDISEPVDIEPMDVAAPIRASRRGHQAERVSPSSAMRGAPRPSSTMDR
jgi:hypothetical protein